MPRVKKPGDMTPVNSPDDDDTPDTTEAPAPPPTTGKVRREYTLPSGNTVRDF